MQSTRTLENLLSDDNYVVTVRYYGGPFIKYSVRDGSFCMERLTFNNYSHIPNGSLIPVKHQIFVFPSPGDNFDPFLEITKDDFFSPEDEIVYSKFNTSAYIKLRTPKIHVPVLFLRTLIPQTS
jgi:hypothetical protein